jgi:hypothetical protein
MDNNYYKYLKYKNKYLKEKKLKKNLVGGVLLPSKPNINLLPEPFTTNLNNSFPIYSSSKSNDTNSMMESIERMRREQELGAAAPRSPPAAAAAPRGLRPYVMPLPDEFEAASASAAPRGGVRPYVMPLPDAVVSRAAPVGIVPPTGDPNSLIDFIHYIINLNTPRDLLSTYTYWENITSRFFDNNINDILDEYDLIKQQLELVRIYRERYHLPSRDDLERRVIGSIRDYTRPELHGQQFCIQLWDTIHRT